MAGTRGLSLSSEAQSIRPPITGAQSALDPALRLEPIDEGHDATLWRADCLRDFPLRTALDDWDMPKEESPPAGGGSPRRGGGRRLLEASFGPRDRSSTPQS